MRKSKSLLSESDIHYNNFINDVRSHLSRSPGRVSWSKAIAAFGHDRFFQFYRTGNMAERTADAMKFIYKQSLKKGNV